MSFASKQFRGLVDDVLKDFAEYTGRPEYYSEDAVELLMLTAAQETLLGVFLKQVRGPALGVFQVEPGAYQSLWDNFIRYDDKLKRAMDVFYAPGAGWRANMMGNLPYQIVLARIYYLARPGKLPNKDNHEAMAKYYKEHWNTYLGKATVEGAIRRYKRYALEE